MISVTKISKGFPSFWKNIAPWLNEYVSFVNKGQIERFAAPLFSRDMAIHRSINNTISFNVFAQLQGKIVREIPADFSEAKEKAFSQLQNLPGSNLATYEHTDVDRFQIKEQVVRLLRMYSGKSLLFDPVFPGYCSILQAQGDFVYNDVLVEVKAGEREISQSDIKQLLIYSSLNYASNNSMDLCDIEVINPRQGIRFVESLDSLCNSISGKTREDLYSDILSFATIMSISN